MSLLQRIKDDSLTARKDKLSGAAILLTTLYSEAAMVGKNNGNRETSDTEVIAIVKKFKANNEETLKVLADTDERYHQALAENEILDRYLPKQMSEDELQSIVTKLIAEHAIPKTPKSMGSVMKLLKDGFEGRYDGALASKIVSAVLKS